MTRGGKFVYLSRRVNCTGFNGCLQGCGGRIEENESPVEGAKRELLEEAGLEIPLERIHHMGTDSTFKNSSGNLFNIYFFRIDLKDDETPRNTEPHLHDDWVLYPIKALEDPKLDLIPGLRSQVIKDSPLLTPPCGW